MTQDAIILRHRLNLLLRVKSIKNMSAACRMFGMSRTIYHKYKKKYLIYGLSGLKDKVKSVPVMPNATKDKVVEKVLSIAKNILLTDLQDLQMSWGTLCVLPLYIIS